MAVAEKTASEKMLRNLQISLGLGSIVGAVYLLVSLGIIFAVLPALWGYLWAEVLQAPILVNNQLLSASLLLVVEVGAGLVLALGMRAVERALGSGPGLRAGIFGAAVLLVLLLWFTHLLAGWLEKMFENQPAVGLVICGAVFAALVLGLWRLLLRPSWMQWLKSQEDNGWFHATFYKPNQGMNVRRGTLVGALVLGICGIITLVSHRSLGSEGVNQLGQPLENNWEIRIPLCGEPLDHPRVSLGIDLAELPNGQGLQITAITGPAGKQGGFKENDILVSIRADSKDISLDSQTKLNEELKTKFKPNEVVKVTVKRDGQTRLIDCPLDRVGDVYATLLYRVHFTVPLILFVSLLWVSWRLVNWPTFADFLIATEAEMNKVSWTTRKRLVRDTVVVLVAVFLLTTYLFVVDMFWVTVLNNRWIGVLQVDVKQEMQKQTEKTQW